MINIPQETEKLKSNLFVLIEKIEPDKVELIAKLKNIAELLDGISSAIQEARK